VYLVGCVRADVLEPGVAAGALELLRKVTRFVEVVRGFVGKVDAVHDTGTGFDETEGHLQSEATVSAGDDANTVGQGKFLSEDGRGGVS
jgi:hypothetical protein